MMIVYTARPSEGGLPAADSSLVSQSICRNKCWICKKKQVFQVKRDRSGDEGAKSATFGGPLSRSEPRVSEQPQGAHIYFSITDKVLATLGEGTFGKVVKVKDVEM